MMKLSARNQFKGKAMILQKGATQTEVGIDSGGGCVITSLILNAAADDLALKVGDEVWAVIKATDVIIGK